MNKAEPLVVLHGWGMNSGVWESVRPALEARYCVSWIDLPGHGRNQHIVANDMDEVVDMIIPNIPQGAHLLGWSLGGLIIQAIAERVPTNLQLQSLTMVASTPRFSQANSWKNAMSDEVLNTFSENLKQDRGGTLKRFIALQFMGVKDAKALQHELLRTLQNWGGSSDITSEINNSQQGLELGLRLLKESDYRKISHNIPKHWILAERDRLIPKAVINDLELHYSGDEITLLKNAGHAPFMSQPEAFITAVFHFIESIKNKRC